MSVFKCVSHQSDMTEAPEELIAELTELDSISKGTHGVSFGAKLESGPLPYRYF